VLVLDGTGKITIEFRFDHTATGWKLCEEKLKQFAQAVGAVNIIVRSPEKWFKWKVKEGYADDIVVRDADHPDRELHLSPNDQQTFKDVTRYQFWVNPDKKHSDTVVVSYGFY
jgi:hypothetical protein